MLCAAAMMAQQVAGKATRDAFFLSNFEVTALPKIVVVAAVLSIAVVFLCARAMAKLTPARFVPLAFTVSAALLFATWWLSRASPSASAIVIYLHSVVFSSLLASGFWSVVNERFDPRTAKKLIGRIAAGGTVGGLAGGLAAERVGANLGVSVMIPFLAAMHLFCAWVIRDLRPPATTERPRALASAGEVEGSLFRTFSELPYLRNIAFMVLLGTISAAILDYVLKAETIAVVPRGEDLMRFFAAFYALVGLVSFFAQTTLSRLFLEKLGLAKTVATLPLGTIALAGVALPFPGIITVALARGGEGVLRASLYRSGYELLYTPLPPGKKRSTKGVIDVAFDRMGDAIGGGLVSMILFAAPGFATSLLLAATVLLSILGAFVALRLHRGYVAALESSLVNRAIELDSDAVRDATTRYTVAGTLAGLERAGLAEMYPSLMQETGAPRTETRGKSDADVVQQTIVQPSGFDRVMTSIHELRSRNAVRIKRVLSSNDVLSPAAAAHVIPLLAWSAVATDAEGALTRAGDRITGQLVDALLHEEEDVIVRRRLPRILASVGSERAAEGLLAGLGVRRFEVRVQCGRALLKMREANGTLAIEPPRVYRAVLREVAVDKGVWESQRLLDRGEERDEDIFIDDLLRERAGRSMEHVFTMLSLVLPKEPLKIAFRGLHTDDAVLRGTALEYLESVLPEPIRDGLWPFLEGEKSMIGHRRSREELLGELMSANASIQTNLEALRRKATRRGSGENTGRESGGSGAT